MCTERLCMLHPWKLLSCIYVGMQICRSFLLGLCGGEPVHICKGSFSLISRQQVADNKINTYKINHHYLELIRLRIRIIRTYSQSSNQQQQPYETRKVTRQRTLSVWTAPVREMLRISSKLHKIPIISSLPGSIFPHIYTCNKNLTPSIRVF